jgi:nucleotide-binding universal stress UspA family protein
MNRRATPALAVLLLGGDPWLTMRTRLNTRPCPRDAVGADYGRRRLSRLTMGSVTQKVLTHSQIPIVVYR